MSLTSTKLESPCVRNCCLNDDDICLGCGRSILEITRWGSESEENKQRVLILAAERKRQINLGRQR